ncbi:MAG TPA: type II secretion system secretin GspD [Burkholderiaceae bacterium]|nr:type II secretion system secretin GspD [Burkholderiaceae bacterium]
MTSGRGTPGARRLSLSRWIALACAVSIALVPASPVLAQSKPAAKTAKNTASSADKQANDSVMLNFVNADIDAVVRAIGQYTGRTFVIDPRVKGTLSLVTERPVTKQQAFEQLLSALRLQGFTIVQTGNVMRVVPEADAKLQGGTVVEPRSPSPGGDQLITQVFRLQYESATAMVPILRPLIAPNNTISAYPQNNTLVITDYAENLRRIQRIIEAIDTPATSDLEMITVKYGLATEIATIVNRVLDEGARAAGQAIDAGQRVSILAEPRTNLLIVRAPSAARLALAKGLIAQLDKPASTPGNINVVYLRNAEATRLAPLLRAIISSDPSYTPQVASSGLSPQGGTSGQPGLTAGGGMATPSTPAATATGGGGSSGGSGPLAGLIQADAATNSLIITAPEPLYRNIRAIIDKLDVRRAQVVIESLIVEMTADKAAEFGIQWQALGAVNNTNYGVVASQNFGGAGTNILGVATNLGSVGQGLNLGVINGKINIPGIGEVINLAFLARALQTTADANILSTPTIQTLDNEEAKFLVGQNIPLITGAYANAGGNSVAGVNPFQTFERKDIGLQLRVKPQITEGGVVRLSIYQELSSIQNTLTAAQGGIITNKRSFESTVLVDDGNIVVLGGLIEDKNENSRSSLPILGRIPGLGYLFSYENRSRTKTNLMVFLRPYVVREEASSSALALDRYAYIRGQVAANTKPDNVIFKGFESTQLPEKPPVPPAMRDRPPAGGAPGPGIEPGSLNGREGQTPAPAASSPVPQPVANVQTTSAAERGAPRPDASAASTAPATAVAAAPVTIAPANAPASTAPSAAVPLPPPAPAPAVAGPTPTVTAPAVPIVEPAVSTVTPSQPASSAASTRSEPAAAATPSRTAAVSAAPSRPAAQAAEPAVSSAAAPAGATTTSPSAATTAAPMTSTSTSPATTAQPVAIAPATSATNTPSSGSSAASAGAPPSTSSNLVQVAAVSQISRGRELQRQLREAGFDAYWESVKTKSGDVVRVRVSIDPATQTVADTVARLKAMGFDPIVVAP